MPPHHTIHLYTRVLSFIDELSNKRAKSIDVVMLEIEKLAGHKLCILSILIGKSIWMWTNMKIVFNELG